MSNVNSADYLALRQKPQTAPFKKGDVLVLFGELFNRGYGNGLVDEAEKYGVTVVRATVGRRDENNQLRALTAEEAALVPQPFINIPLEAGFDLETDSLGQTPNDYLKSVKLSDWNSAQVPEKTLFEAREKGKLRFQKNTQLFLQELQAKVLNQLQPGSHVHFAHLMAGGVPRAKIILPILNRIFKGTGDRYQSSQDFWNGSLGQYLKMNFVEVTADTFDTLVTESTNLRKELSNKGISTSYVAYGYHGTEILVNNEYRWQSYAPYLQGWAKIQLEDYSKKWFSQGVKTCVYNCPEILTNSSSIFQGVEIPLYNLVRALEKEKPNHPITIKARKDCSSALKNESDIETIFNSVDSFVNEVEAIGTSCYQGWPHHSQKIQLEKTLGLSDLVISLHKDEKQLMTGFLSEIIFKSCGYIMLHDGFNPQQPVAWIGHDVVAKCIE